MTLTFESTLIRERISAELAPVNVFLVAAGSVAIRPQQQRGGARGGKEASAVQRRRGRTEVLVKELHLGENHGLGQKGIVEAGQQYSIVTSNGGRHLFWWRRGRRGGDVCICGRNKQLVVVSGCGRNVRRRRLARAFFAVRL